MEQSSILALEGDQIMGVLLNLDLFGFLEQIWLAGFGSSSPKMSTEGHFFGPSHDSLSCFEHCQYAGSMRKSHFLLPKTVMKLNMPYFQVIRSH